MTALRELHDMRVARLRPPPRSMQTRRMSLYAQLLVSDILCLSTGILGVGLVFDTMWRPFSGVAALMIVVPIYLLMGLYGGAFGMQVLRHPVEGARRALTALALAIFITLLVVFFSQTGDEVSRLTFAVSGLVSAGTLFAGRLVFGSYVRRVTDGRLVTDLVISDRPNARAPHGATLVHAPSIGLHPDINNPEMLHRFGIITQRYDRVIVDCDPRQRPAWALMLKGADVNGEVIAEQFNDVGAVAISKFHQADTLVVARRTLSMADQMKKRALDLVLTVPLLVLIAPLLAVVALAIRFETPGPILFKQARVGRGNRQFMVLKFRSMRVEQCDAGGNASTQRDDDRVTRVGRFIRRTSIDELPQLLNVVLGDMSLVGPRPHALGSKAGQRLFWEVDQTYWHRHRLTPGITGLAQIRGFRGATHYQEDLINRLQADLEYVEGWSIWRDIGILVQTLRVIVHHNAY
jgi:polysaccharide biosynthesis protein PslA